ncbi:ribosome recycling factor [Candidatus Giovannonibacteria bacterium RIFCSPLOWO2_02_FULL_43_11b]|uniref:Ribosome recycling factor n=1 Tax=Candidatus Giovannonibacteria bacterium RIFCSPHIGHO2_12_FULL_43_15 TaxID=1798341 RepID=A0A1F5WQC7_9BACT|nr:MAG: ribosome recycling factor [Candidatus Giovannonibacteria bacterium RIFCSPHIGHO2_01_FULL_43_100]OGF67299.1 MAG: ribosome recycling factor [Candidatus Giovannonibacteria bacterium RIFCSPHIGHO2_02_FULL_43_32]OGF77787.1 MAG: ribosome recycling factor [Candidatus Giovannonibacteria bacterium RIFCSPHIGHO2_12_FULL_43_15]OGF78580.1 MAG: ribosome recycling factor [Candidatus Giovannonibacteria bacterium RIFCSPLOWO2_01_FULL_43_60]OGF90017.1 MAG: ribosome recycling factor [Candidatus Giovannonibac
MMAYDFKKMEEKLNFLASHFEFEMTSLRTGRATPALLENVRVEVYGSANQLKNVASIVVEDAKTLLVQPWDKGLMETISKAIETSNIGVQPVVAKDSIRISLPSLTEERRKALVKILKEKTEEAKISLRKARDEVWRDIQEKEKAKTISEDEKFRFKEEMEKKIKHGGEKLDEIAAKKEREIME